MTSVEGGGVDDGGVFERGERAILSHAALHVIIGLLKMVIA